MHYKNGREANNGDKVVLLTASGWDPAGIPNRFNATVGILYDATAGNDHCNGRLAVISPNDPMPDLTQCLHLDDAIKALEAAPDSSKP